MIPNSIGAPRVLRGVAWAFFLLLAACGRAPEETSSTVPASGIEGAGAQPGGPGTDAGTPGDRPILVRGNGPEPDSLDPQRARNVESGNVLRDVYQTLTEIGRDGEPVPGAAREWSVSEDGLRWTFRLRAEARWSNGNPVVAEDFAAALRRLVDPATASQYAQVVDAIRGATGIITGRQPPSELGVAALDPLTLEVQLERPTPYLAGLLSHWSTMPVHRPTLQRLGAGFAKPGNAVSNGAFTLTRWVQGAQIDLARNPRYWNDAATQLAGVRWISQSDESAEYKRYRSGELHVTYVVPRGPFDQIRREHAAELRIGPQLGVYFIGFNFDREPFRSRAGLRRALSLAIDRRRLTDSVTRLGELPAYGWVPSGTYNYSSQRFDYADTPLPERLAEARRLYAEAGYSAQRPLQFELRYNTGEIHNRIAVAVSQMWKQALGVQARLVAVEFKVLQQDIDARKVDLFRLAWIGDYNDPYTFAQYFRSDFGINTARYRNPAYDAALDAAAAELDPSKRRARLEAAERLLLADHAVLPLYFYVNKHLVSPRVRGWYDNVMNVVYSKDLALVQ
jgi:oligopeptide transport system substrate-binding protein